jgi:putative copper export protein
MLPLHLSTLRLFLHVTAAAVWVGGQLTLAGIVPVLRPFGPDVTRAAAHRFNQVAWTAFVVLLLTGIWNIASVDVGAAGARYAATLLAKLALVAASGLGAAAHTLNRSKVALAVGGALALVAGLGALLLGITLHGG